MTATAGTTLAQRRMDLVRRHVEVENAQDIDGLPATLEQLGAGPPDPAGSAAELGP